MHAKEHFVIVVSELPVPRQQTVAFLVSADLEVVSICPVRAAPPDHSIHGLLPIQSEGVVANAEICLAEYDGLLFFLLLGELPLVIHRE